MQQPIPLTGTIADTAAHVLGPYNPIDDYTRDLWVTLWGTWAGVAQVLRSTDGGTNKLPITVGGQAWASYTSNAQEAFGSDTDPSSLYYLSVTLTSGTINYRLSQ